ncbi:MAG: hypothetical protein N3J91_09825 [Verrucomicrobiae bacterium]|nr:hypothetical protein [Verrucomicrobiae bacterium]
MALPKKLKLLLGGLVLLPTLYAANYFVTPNLIGVTKLEERCRPRGKLKFDSETWKQAAPTSGRRFEMVDDLLKADTLFNLDANQVENLLGKADIVSDQQGEKQFVYVLGDQRAYPARSIWFPRLFANRDRWMLEVRLRNGKVSFAKVFFT